MQARNEFKLNAVVKAGWAAGAGPWWAACTISITNFTDGVILDPVIEFDMPGGQPISMNSGFSFNRVGDHVTGHLQDWLKKIAPHSTIEFSIGVTGNGSALGLLPNNFKLDGVSADVPDYDEAPSVPQDLVAKTGSKTVSLSWRPSTDKFAVDSYIVKYSRVNGPGGKEPGLTRQTRTNSITIGGLEPSATYKFRVSAVNIAGTVSERSHPIRVTTLRPLPDRGDWTMRRAVFIDYTAYPTPQVSRYSAQSGLTGYFLGFVVARPGGDKKVYWGGNSSIVDSNADTSVDASAGTFPGDATISGYGKQDIQALRAMGGDVILSFGGASNVPLEMEETNIDRMVDIYDQVIRNYGLTHIDFDFEGAMMHNTAAQDRHVAVMADLLMSHPTLQISYTLPVDGAPGSLEGFNDGGVNFLKKLEENDIQPSLINGMLMEFGQSSPSDAYECCVIGLEGMYRQIKTIFTQWSDEKIWRRMGACPMFGRHNNGKIFTLEHQRQLVEFATEKNLGCLSGWDATRDANQGSLDVCNDLTGGDLAKCTYVKQKPFDFAKVIQTYKPAV